MRRRLRARRWQIASGRALCVAFPLRRLDPTYSRFLTLNRLAKTTELEFWGPVTIYVRATNARPRQPRTAVLQRTVVIRPNPMTL
jgi:hypothetical protein